MTLWVMSDTLQIYLVILTICDTQFITFMKVIWQFQSDTGSRVHLQTLPIFPFNFIFFVFWYYSIFVFVVAGGWGTTFICWRLDGSVLVGEFLTRATTTNTPEFDADISIFAKIFLWKVNAISDCRLLLSGLNFNFMPEQRKQMKPY